MSIYILKRMSKQKFVVVIKNNFTQFALIFISVMLAFALSEWSSHKGGKLSEEKIYLEILNGLKKDSIDLVGNINAHETGIKACSYWRNAIIEGSADKDSLTGYYFLLTRGVIAVQNVSGYETLKSKGLETIKNDELREKIISLYEFDYQVMRKFEEDYQENQFFQNYFFEINKKIAPNLNFDLNGNIIGIDLPLNLTKEEKNILLSYLWKIQTSRTERMYAAKGLEKKISSLYNEIKNGR